MKKLITLFISILMFSIGYTQNIESRWEESNSVTIHDIYLNTEIVIPTNIKIKFATNPTKIVLYTTPLTILNLTIIEKDTIDEMILFTGKGVDQDYNSIYVLISFIANTNKMTAVALIYNDINYIYKIKQ